MDLEDHNPVVGRVDEVGTGTRDGHPCRCIHFRVLIRGHPPFSKESAVSVEQNPALVRAVGDVEAARAVNRKASGDIKGFCSPLPQPNGAAR